MKMAGQVSWAIDGVSRRRKASEIVRRPSAIQAEKKNVGEAQAYCPQGVVNRMMKQADLTSEEKRLRAPQRRHA